MTKEIPSPNVEGRSSVPRPVRHSDFGFPTALHRDYEPRNRRARCQAPINRTHSKRFARSRDVRQSRSVWSACAFSAAFNSLLRFGRPTVHGEPPFAFCACIGTMNRTTNFVLHMQHKVGTGLIRFMESPLSFSKSMHWG